VIILNPKVEKILPNIIKDYFEIDKNNINLTFIESINNIKELKDYLNHPKTYLYDYITICLQNFYQPIMEKIRSELQGKLPTFEELKDYIYNYILKNEFQKFENISSALIKDKIESLGIPDDIPVHNPNRMYKVNDDINDEFMSSKSPFDFSEDRISPLIIIDDDVLIGNNSIHHADLIEQYKKKHHLTDDDLYSDVAYDNGYDQFDGKNVGVGSLFNGKVALLEYVTGKLDENNIEGQQDNSGNIKAIANTLKANGIQKVYISSAPWNPLAIYKRVAKTHLRLKKI